MWPQISLTELGIAYPQASMAGFSTPAPATVERGRLGSRGCGTLGPEQMRAGRRDLRSSHSSEHNEEVLD